MLFVGRVGGAVRTLLGAYLGCRHVQTGGLTTGQAMLMTLKPTRHPSYPPYVVPPWRMTRFRRTLATLRRCTFFFRGVLA